MATILHVKIGCFVSWLLKGLELVERFRHRRNTSSECVGSSPIGGRVDGSHHQRQGSVVSSLDEQSKVILQSRRRVSNYRSVSSCQRSKAHGA